MSVNIFPLVVFDFGASRISIRYSIAGMVKLLHPCVDGQVTACRDIDIIFLCRNDGFDLVLILC